jgi:Holliday junction DNA helicase RuvA
LSTEQTFVNVYNDHKGDAVNALISLGYKQVQADKAVKLVYNEGMSSEDIIRLSLKSML